MRQIVTLFCLIAAFPAFAEEPLALPEPPTLPPAVQSGEALEPEITITNRNGEIVHEYRVNGTVYMTKIIPSSGPAYYLIDQDGDGNLETRHSDLNRNINVPQWLIHSW